MHNADAKHMRRLNETEIPANYERGIKDLTKTVSMEEKSRKPYGCRNGQEAADFGSEESHVGLRLKSLLVLLKLTSFNYCFFPLLHRFRLCILTYTASHYSFNTFCSLLQ